eukprot:scaffold21250_cov48-Phaeocystis_antarctica.AAC.1
MHITVVGGGNSTPIFAALAADAGHTVSILTRKPEAWNKDDIGFVNEDLEYMPQARPPRWSTYPDPEPKPIPKPSPNPNSHPNPHPVPQTELRTKVAMVTSDPALCIPQAELSPTLAPTA